MAKYNAANGAIVCGFKLGCSCWLQFSSAFSTVHNMEEVEIFVTAESKESSYAKLVSKPGITASELELEGARFGHWLLENGSTSFLKGLHHLFDEAEITKKIGLGY